MDSNQGSTADDSFKLYVYGLAPNTKAAALKAHFLRFGKVTSAKILQNKVADPPRLFGLIIMSTRAEAENAFNALNNTDFEGRNIHFKIPGSSASRNPSSQLFTDNASHASSEDVADANASTSQPNSMDTSQGTSASAPTSQPLPNQNTTKMLNQSASETSLESSSPSVTSFPDTERATTPTLPSRQVSQRARRGRGKFVGGGRNGNNSGSTQSDASQPEVQAGDAIDERVVMNSNASTSTSIVNQIDLTLSPPHVSRVAERTVAASTDGEAGTSNVRNLQITIHNSKDEPESLRDPEEDGEDREPLIVDMNEQVAAGETARLVDPLGLADGAFPPLQEPDAPPAAASSDATTDQKQPDKKDKDSKADAAGTGRERTRSGAGSSDRDREKDHRGDRDRGRERDKERSRERERDRHAHRPDEKGHETEGKKPEQPLTQAELEARERDLRERERRVERRARDVSHDRDDISRRERDLRNHIQLNKRRTDELIHDKESHRRSMKHDLDRLREDRTKLDADRKELERQRRELEDKNLAVQKRDLALAEEKHRVEQWALEERSKLERWAQELTKERESERLRALAALNAAAQHNPPPLPPLAQPAWGPGGHGAPPPHPAPAAPSISDRLGWQSGERDRDRDGRDHDYRSDRDARDVRAPGGGGARSGDRFEFQPGGRPSSRDRDRRAEWPDRAPPPDPRRASGDRGFSPRSGAPGRSRSRSPLRQHSTGRGHPHETGAPMGPMGDAPLGSRVGPLGGRLQLTPTSPPSANVAANASAFSASFQYSSNWRSGGGGEGSSSTHSRWQPSGSFPTIKAASLMSGAGGAAALSTPPKFGSPQPTPQSPMSNLWNSGGSQLPASHQQHQQPAFGGGASGGPSQWNTFGRR